MSKHSEAVEHLKRHTELRRRVAEEAVKSAVGQDQEVTEDADAETGG